MSLIIAPSAAPNNVIFHEVEGGLQVGPMSMSWLAGQNIAVIDLTAVVKFSNFSAKSALIDNTKSLLQVTLTDSNQNNYIVQPGQAQFVPVSWLPGSPFTVKATPYLLGYAGTVPFSPLSDQNITTSITLFNYEIEPGIIQAQRMRYSIALGGSQAQPFLNYNDNVSAGGGTQLLNQGSLNADVTLSGTATFGSPLLFPATLKNVTASLIVTTTPTANISGLVRITGGPTSLQDTGPQIYWACPSTATAGQIIYQCLPFPDIILNGAQGAVGNQVYLNNQATGNTMSGGVLTLALNYNQNIG